MRIITSTTTVVLASLINIDRTKKNLNPIRTISPSYMNLMFCSGDIFVMFSFQTHCLVYGNTSILQRSSSPLCAESSRAELITPPCGRGDIEPIVQSKQTWMSDCQVRFMPYQKCLKLYCCIRQNIGDESD